jgi:Putative auto-transporter adhesin, head GIN domain
MRFRAPCRASSFAPAVAALAAVLVVAGCGLASFNAAPTAVAGTGAVTTEDRTAGGFTSISVSGGLNVVIASGDAVAVKVTAQPNLLPLIQTQVANGQLTASIAGPGLSSGKPVTVAVTIPKLTSLTLASGATGTMELRTDLLVISLSGGATLQAIGSVTQLALTADGGAQAKLGDMAADTATVLLSGGSQATLNVKSAVTGSADSGAALTLSTKPASMTVKTSNGATVAGG